MLYVHSIARRPFSSASWLLLFISLINVRSSAQGIPENIKELGGPRPGSSLSGYSGASPNLAVLVVHAFDEEKPVKLDRPARFDLTNLANHEGEFLIAQGHKEAVFINVELGKYDLTVTAVGYVSTHQEIDVLSPVTQPVDVVLHRDPYAVTLGEAPSLMSHKAKKEADRAVSLLESGELTDARKHLEKAYKLAPSNADLNFLLGYLNFEQENYGQAATYLNASASLRPHSAQTLILLGRTNLIRKNYPAARSALEQAILDDDGDWLPHDLLADTYLNLNEYSKARDEAQIAISKGARYGKLATGPAELALGQALIGLGQKDKGIQALEVFLKESPQNPMVYQVRALISRIQKSASVSGAGPEINASRADPLGAVPKPGVSMQTWRPPDVDDARPTLVSGVTCPGTKVLAGVGKEVQELVENVTRFGADETLFSQQLNRVGLSTDAQTREYNYLAAISSQPAGVFIDEYRSDKFTTHSGFPDSISTTGFVMLALIFQPKMQGDFDFDCEGQGKWHGQPSWLMHFRQRPDRPNHIHSYTVGGKTFRVDLKGRAWISADTFQIERIDADIVKPVPEIQLLSEHEKVEYGPVRFPKRNTSLWLPKSAEIYFDFRKHHYYRRHSFDHYMLFGVDASEKDKAPVDEPAQPGTRLKENSKVQ